MDDKGIRKWSGRKLQNTEILSVLSKEFSKSKEIMELSRELRSVEEDARNKAAHTMTSITEERIVKWTGLTPHIIMEKIKQFAEMAGFPSKKTYEDSYDSMNEEIKKEIHKLFH